VNVGARLALAALATLLLAVAACSGNASGPPATATVSPVEHGRALFRNKGCVTCHQNDRVEGKTGLLQVGPNLTNYHNDPEFLRAWLDNPRALKPETPMPDLGLTTTEIEDLIAFLTETR
jgi:cytochrome c oxidase subunit 2